VVGKKSFWVEGKWPDGDKVYWGKVEKNEMGEGSAIFLLRGKERKWGKKNSSWETKAKPRT